MTDVVETVAPRLPRGPHRLSREEVERDQKLRLALGMAEAVREHGYVGTPVAEVLRRAGVSRETFYRFYDGKLDCFLATFDLIGEILTDHLARALDGSGDPLERWEQSFEAYLELLAAEPGFARIVLVEVHAAGPEAMARRAAIQDRIVDSLVGLFGARSDQARFACQTIVAAVSAMVTGPLVAGDADALRALRDPVVGHVRALHAAGLLTE
jgi:AcrR family transcriptional regulator